MGSKSESRVTPPFATSAFTSKERVAGTWQQQIEAFDNQLVNKTLLKYQEVTDFI